MICFVRKDRKIIILFACRYYGVEMQVTMNEKEGEMKRCSEAAFQNEIPYVIFLFNVLSDEL